MPHPAQQITLQEYIETVYDCKQRIERISEQMRQLSKQTRLYGSELGDLTRFDSPVKLMSFVFNCYPKNDQGLLRWIRFHLIYKPLRAVLSRMPFWAIVAYARLMGFLRLIPRVGIVLEKLNFCVQGDVPNTKGALDRIRRRYCATVLNTFHAYGSHTYQHHKTDEEIRALVRQLQCDESKVLNADRYFLRPQPNRVRTSRVPMNCSRIQPCAAS